MVDGNENTCHDEKPNPGPEPQQGTVELATSIHTGLLSSNPAASTMPGGHHEEDRDRLKVTLRTLLFPERFKSEAGA